MRKKTLTDVPDGDWEQRVVLVRVDHNVPLEGGEVGDDTRLRGSLPTLEHLSERGARTVLLSHLGRPGGRTDPELSLGPVAGHLSRLLGRGVTFVPEVAGAAVEEAVSRLGEGDVLVLENTRFHPGETADDPQLAEAWAGLGDLYVNDAFGAAHRAHASTHALPLRVREGGGVAVAGHLMERELRFLGETLEDPDRPFVAVLGGAKVSGKIDAIRALLSRVDRLLIGGAMANTFFLSLGLEVGRSLVEEDCIDLARELLEEAGSRILLPVDCITAPEIGEGVEGRAAERDRVREDEVIGDVGPRTRELFGAEIRAARTVVWNGPMGVFERRPFRAGTEALARALAEASDGGCTTIVGGGDSAAAVEEAGVADRMTHVSTGGGASLELLSGAELPAVAALSER